jgi:putative ABC transport system ATP-binding protein
MVEAVGLVKHYESVGGEVVRAVDEVDLRVARGELVAVYGPSGSGKTTLLELIAGVQRPDRGRVLVDARDLSRFSDAEADAFRLKTLGVVPQSLALLEGPSALDLAALRLVEMGLKWPKAREQVEPLLDRLGLTSRADHQVDALSKGERQRVALAMALATDPSLVLADEPTANLDTDRGRDVLSLLVEFCRERPAAVVMVTHDPQAAEFADRVLELRDGQLVAATADVVAPPPASG